MKKTRRAFHPMKNWALAMASCIAGLMTTTQTTSVEAAEGLGGPPHIGTFEGSTTFTTTSRNGINPGLYLEVMDEYGNYTEYTSEDGMITIPNTQEGAYVTQAKLLGKTKYVDQVTGEVLDQWEEGRDLQLISSEGAGLRTVGKNLFDGRYIDTTYSSGIAIIKNNTEIKFPFKTGNNSRGVGFGLEVSPNTTYTVSVTDMMENSTLLVSCFSDKSMANNSTNKIAHYGSVNETVQRKSLTFTTPSDCYYVVIGNYIHYNFEQQGGSITFETAPNIQLEESSTVTTYEPYRSSLLSINEDVTLRNVSGLKDELDLTAGKMIKRIGEIVLDGGEAWEIANTDTENTIRYRLTFTDSARCNRDEINMLSDKIKVVANSGWKNDVEQLERGHGDDYVSLRLLKTKASTVRQLKTYLQSNPITVQYELANSIIKTVGLNSTYYFQPILNREVRVDGIILPLVASVTIPTDPLTFIIDPNQAEGQQFVAPDFSVTNNTPASISLNLKAFEQTTQVLNDVLPEAHENWRRLNKAQSKDIALALVPQPSKGWLSLIEGPRYVADKSNYQLGEVDAEATVAFTFSAMHGRAIIERLAPQYRLAFEFGF